MDSNEDKIYELVYVSGWDEHFLKMDKSVQEQVIRKIEKQKFETQTRHLKFGVDFYVTEAGQYRIAMRLKENEKIKEIHFAGNHKQYEKWYQAMGFGDEDGKIGFYEKYLAFISAFAKTSQSLPQ